MKILAISDEEVPSFYEYYTPGVFSEYDLILACGDLKKIYLEFIVTLAPCPVLYVRGNHDESFDTMPPEGCTCIEDQIYVYNGIRIMGLGGCYKYREGRNYYTEKEMKRRLRKLWFQLRKHKGIDILLTHAPAYQLNDMEHMTHRGFQCFLEIMEKYKPRFFVHGHIHRNYGRNIPQKSKYQDTTVINACGYCVLEFNENIK